jgi:hypothetical protein
VAPAFPFIVAPVLRVFGDTPTGRAAITILNAAWSALAYAAWPLMARRCGLPWQIGLWSAAIPALVPIYGTVETSFFETALSTLASVVVLLETIRLCQAETLRPRDGVLLGSLWAAALLTAPQLLLVMAGFVVCLVGRNRPAAASGGFALALVLTVATLLTPWTVRNYAATGGVVFVRSNLGLELQVSNHNGASPFWYGNWDFIRGHHPFLSAEESRTLGVLGEAAYGRRQGENAVAWMWSKPGAFVWLTARRIWFFWIFPGDIPLNLSWVYCLLTALAVYGVVHLRRINPIASDVLVVFVVGFPLPYYLIELDARYRLPFCGVMFFLAACGAHALLEPGDSADARGDGRHSAVSL